MKNLSFYKSLKFWVVFCLVSSILAISFSFYVEYVLQIAPCRLCIIQRATYITSTPLLLLVLFSRLNGTFLLRIIEGCFICGASVSAYHLMIQFGLVSYFSLSPSANIQH